ncbi:glycosyltransferase family A protein [uncultured Roseibium sp.]|uniref:glycosyltransferase family 2 protein n=1 Tax=uncultured Roseibium sp. TaxID=1936171 RepID=UPI002630573B|nr:glycosyltransferase family A protein [uncultured Roseibium sp.]
MSKSRYQLHDLTIVITAKNAEKTIAFTLSSLVPTLERGASCIIVNDCSEDKTAEVIRQFEKTNKQTVTVTNSASLGAGISRNIAIEKVETAIFAPLDADDWVSNSFYNALIAGFNFQDSIDFVRCHYTECRGSYRKIVRAPFAVTHRPFPPQLAIKSVNELGMVDHPQMWAGAYSVDFFKKNNIYYDELATAEDRIVNWKTQLLAKKMCIVEEAGIFYRREHSPEALTEIGDLRQLDFLEAMLNIINFVTQNKYSEHLPKAIRQSLALICHHISKKDRLNKDVVSELRKRSRIFLRKLPQSQLSYAIQMIEPERKKIIKELL